jgi:protoheme IX farnesyltransferase
MSAAVSPVTAPGGVPGQPAFGLPGRKLLLSLRDLGELTKARVTSLIVLTAWCGFYMGAVRSGIGTHFWSLVHALAGIGLAAGGTAALNEAMERDLDGRMRRTAIRPLVTGRISLRHGIAVGLVMVLGGSLYLGLAANWLAAALTFLTSAAYLLAYTPLKRFHPVCTLVGAVPGAMPPVLGWAAVRGHVGAEALILFAILFFWQFPHFHAIAWLYREDYERAGIRMLPVVAADGRATAREVIVCLSALLATTILAAVWGMAGRIYLLGALVLGAMFWWYGWRLAASRLSPLQTGSKRLARRLLQASILYLPALFALMMLNAIASFR